ncbi:copper resistance CopC family protein [Pseudonocardia xishanensis]|uniref:CopC domain-containing protein n=1 Tax=Pseudonocardia xishanensis TaxID=630995 RepID=A0ABP8RPL7_9PSEU
MTAVAERPVVDPPRRRVLRPLLALVLLVAAVWGVVLAALPTPSADPLLVSSTPEMHELVQSPDEVRLTFDRPVPAALATIGITSATGDQVVSGRPYRPADAGDDTIAVAMPETRYEGTYWVSWSVPTANWETAQGRFEFSIYAPTADIALPELRTDPHPVLAVALGIARGIGLVGFVLLLATAFRAAAHGVGDLHRSFARTWWTTAAATAATFLLFGGYAARTGLWGALDPALVPATAASEVGTALLARLGGLVIAAIGLRFLARAGSGSAPRAVAVLLAGAALAVTFVVASPHEPGGPAPLALVAGAAMLLAAGVVVGTLFATEPRTGLLLPAALVLVASGLTGGLTQAAVLAVAGVVVALGGLLAARAPASMVLRLVVATATVAAVVAVGLLPAGPALLVVG